MNAKADSNNQKPATGGAQRQTSSRFQLSKLKAKQNSTGSIAIRFNASSMADDDEDDYDLIGDLATTTKPGASDPLQFEVRSEDKDGEGTGVKPPAAVGTAAGASRRSCKSAPVSEVTTPVSSDKAAIPGAAISQPSSAKQQDTAPVKEESERSSSEKSSILSGIRDRLQDPLNALMDKVEELSGESGIAEAIDRKLKIRSESLDSDRANQRAAKSSDPAEPTVNGQDNLSNKSERGKESRQGSFDADTESLTNGTQAGSPAQRPNSIERELIIPEEVPLYGSRPNVLNGRGRTSSLEIVDDFFTEDLVGIDDSGMSSGSGLRLTKSSSSGEIQHASSDPDLHDVTQRQTKHVLRLRKGKSRTKGQADKPVSFSGLLSTTTKDNDEISDDLFYDVKDSLDGAEPSDQSKQAEEEEVIESPSTTDVCPAPPVLRHLTPQRILLALLLLILYALLPLPTYISGIVLGALLTAIIIFTYQWIHAPPTPKEPFVLPDLKTLPPLQVPLMKDSKNKDGKFKAWMNELSNYDPNNYHINQAHSVFVQLEGSMLRLQTPKTGVPKRAMWNEIIPAVSFVRQRHYDLSGSKVFLLPPELVRKRLWSKKYPICIALAKTGSSHPVLEKKGSVDSDTSSVTGGSVSDARRESTSDESLLYLFTRTGREKEEWYRRLDAAAKNTPLPTQLADLVYKLTSWKTNSVSRDSRDQSSLEESIAATTGPTAIGMTTKHKRQGSADSSISEQSESTQDQEQLVSWTPEDTLTEYMKYMSRIMPSTSSGRTRTSQSGRRDSRRDSGPQPVLCDPTVLWANAALGRLFWDFLREGYWADKVKEKIQRKLSKIHVPYFIDELTVTGIELGSQIPVIRKASEPFLDDRGLWIDVDMTYSGGFHMILQTKVNLMKLKNTPTKAHPQEKRSPVTDSDEEDSAESSTDDEQIEESTKEVPEDRSSTASTPAAATGGNTSKKLLRIVDRIAKSRYFQQATEYKYIKKAMEGVSNTKLMLTVELKNVMGTLAVNIPPPPTDRIWYGFRQNPKLWLSAKPRVGEREVNVSHITDWIEKKLTIEFQRVLVMPNMDDIPLPLMCDHMPQHPGDAGS